MVLYKGGHHIVVGKEKISWFVSFAYLAQVPILIHFEFCFPFFISRYFSIEISFICQLQINKIWILEKYPNKKEIQSISFDPSREMVFCYQNCSDLVWEKIVLVIEKNFWNSRLKAEKLQNFWDHLNDLFKQWKVRTECFLNLFLEISQISKNRTTIIQIGKNHWDLETCRKS